MGEKRFYWLKLYVDFFNSKRIKKLRSIAGGDTYTIIYLKMLLKALQSDGYLQYEGVLDTFAEELAMDLDENEDDVKITIQFLMNVGLLETNDQTAYRLTYLDDAIGSECASAKRMRELREREKNNLASQCDDGVTQALRSCDAIEKEIEKDIEKDKEKEIENKKRDINTICSEPPATSPMFVSLLVKDGTEYQVSQDEVDGYKELYPTVDVEQELRSMKGWLADNPGKRKTRSGMKRFIGNWLRSAVNRSGSSGKECNAGEAWEEIE